MHYRDLGEFGCPVPAVDRQGQRPAHPHIIEGLFLVVGFHQGAAIPVVGLHSDLVAKRLEKLVAGGRRKPAEFDRRAVTADRLDSNGLLLGIDASKAVKIRQALVIVIGVFHPLDGLASLEGGKLEWAGAHKVFLVPMGIFVEDRLFVDPVVGIGAGRNAVVGNFNRKTTVEGSGASTWSTIMKKLWRALLTPSGGSIILFQLATTSSADSVEPSCHLTP